MSKPKISHKQINMWFDLDDWKFIQDKAKKHDRKYAYIVRYWVILLIYYKKLEQI